MQPSLHGWVSQPRAEFWGMLGKPLEEVAEIYGWIDEQPHLAAYVVSVGETPVGLFQTYDPEVDEIGRFYDRRPGDLGVHLLLADAPERAGHTPQIMEVLAAHCFADPAVRRIVMEPDHRNEKSIALFESVGAELGPLVELPAKTARFAFIER